jgi:hypothetical protein
MKSRHFHSWRWWEYGNRRLRRLVSVDAGCASWASDSASTAPWLCRRLMLVADRAVSSLAIAAVGQPPHPVLARRVLLNVLKFVLIAGEQVT